VQATLILAGALATAVVSLAFGQLLLGLLRLRLAGLERAALAFLAGSGLLSMAVFLLAAAGLAQRGAYAVVGAVAIAGAHKRLFSFGRLEGPRLGRMWRLAAAGLFGVFTWIYLLHAIGPEYSPDGSSYHLGLVSLYDQAGRLLKITDSMFALFPQGIEMLFLHAFAVGKHSAASLVEFLFLAALAALLYSYGRRSGHPLAGLLASFGVYASPIAGWAGTRAYIDTAVAALVFGMFYLLSLWEEGLPDGALIPAGLLAGFAFGSKYTAALAVPAGLAFVVAVLWRRERLGARAPAAFLLAALPMFSVWLIRNWLWVGNPLAPFFNRWFPNPYFFPSFEAQYAAALRWPGHLVGWGDVLLDVTVQGGAVQGLLGPLFLLAPAALLSLRTPAGRRLCAAAVVFAATYPLNKGTRFLLPALPFVALAMALGLAKYRRIAGVLIVGHAFASFPAVVNRYANPYAVRLESAPTLAEAFRRSPEEEFLRAKRFGYEPARLVDRLVPEGQQVYAFLAVAQAYSRRRMLVYHTSARANMAGETLFTALDAVPLFGGKPLASGVGPELAPVCEMEYSFPALKARGFRLVQPAGAPRRLWVVTDIRAFSGIREIPWPASARFTASHSRWYAGRAFDSNPVTLWSSREEASEGMYIQASLAEPLELDRLTIRVPRDQRDLAPVLEITTESGRMVTPSGGPDLSVLSTPTDLRALASRQLLREGIDYLLVNEGNLVADDFRERAAEWNLGRLGSAEDFTLYRILR